jgi:hypothetical protein
MPMVLVVAGRRRGEHVPAAHAPLIGNPIVAALVAGVFLFAVLLHGLVIWDAPLARAAALGVAAVMAGAIAGAWRLGAFRPRTVIELRREPERDLGVLAVTAAGQAVAAPVLLDGRSAATGAFERFSRVREAVVDLPAGAPRDVYVWAHHVTPDGDSEDIPVAVDVDGRRVVIRP